VKATHYLHCLIECLSVVGIGFCFCAAAQTNFELSEKTFYIRAWQNEQGLPNNTVRAITQTHDGYLWLGTDAGLARFDGVRSRLFGLADGLKNLQVTALLEDRGGMLWIGTGGGGLARMAQGGGIKTYNVSDGLAGDSISSFVEAANGDIWVGTHTGLSRWHDGRFEPVAKELGTLMVFDMAKDRQGDILAATLHHGLLRFHDGQYSVADVETGTITNNPRCVLVDSHDRVWVGLREKRVLCCEHGIWTDYGTNRGFPAVVAYHMAEASDGTIWIGSWNDGLYYFQSGRFNALQKKDGLSDNAILSFFLGRDKFLWVGTQSGGLNRIGAGNLSVDHVMENSSECQLRSLAQTSSGEFWVGTYGQGLYRWHENQSKSFVGEPTRSHLLVEAVMAGRDGSLWWGAATALYQWKDGRIITHFSGNDEPWLNGDHILCLCEDRADGIWIGTFNGKVGFLKQGVVSYLKGLSGKPVTALVQEPDGTLWIGSLGAGLGRFHDGKLTVLTTKDGLQSDLIRCLLLESDGTLWIGTDGGGLNRWSNGRMVGFSKREGLQDDIILQILADDDGCLWLGCNQGIYRITKHSLNDVANGRSVPLRPLKFGISEGMPSEQCVGNFGAALKTQSGRLWFATTAGIVVIDPRRQTPVAALPIALIEEARVDKQKTRNILLDSLVHATDDAQNSILTIPPGNHSLEIDFTGIGFAAPEKIRFRYRLEELDPGWTEAGEIRVARYSYIPPGNYRFRVQAGYPDKPWNETGAGMAIIAQPNFWQTHWFKVLLAFVILSLIAGGVRLIERRRYRMRLKRIQHERAMENERIRIARDLHDELGSQLTHISMMSDLGQPEANAGTRLEKLEKRVQSISKVSVKTVRSLDEIVWAVNPRNDTLRSLTEYLTQFAREILEDSKVNCRFQIADNLPDAPLPPELRHSLYLVVREAMTNALKYSLATQISLGVKTEGRQLEIFLQDNGVGFNPATVQACKKRNGLENMRQRIEALGGKFFIETQLGRGTIIRLRVNCPAADTK
jgi:signal transduction histidine kinase/ligand-binding sensor domain-containing protein